MKLLVVEDRIDLNRSITDTLKSDGYDVDSCTDSEDAIDLISSTSYDGIILNIMMPRSAGLRILRKLRADGSSTPVLHMTEKNCGAYRIHGLHGASDDYIVRPFSVESLCAKVRTMLLKAHGVAESVISVSDLEVNTALHTVRRAGETVKLSDKEYMLLEFLVRNKGMAVSREIIEQNIWKIESISETNVIDVYISYLRRKIDDNRKNKLIHTVRGKGYMIKE